MLWIISYSIHKLLKVLRVSVWPIIRDVDAFVLLLNLVNKAKGVVSLLWLCALRIKMVLLVSLEKLKAISDFGIDMPAFLPDL